MGTLFRNLTSGPRFFGRPLRQSSSVTLSPIVRRGCRLRRRRSRTAACFSATDKHAMISSSRTTCAGNTPSSRAPLGRQLAKDHALVFGGRSSTHQPSLLKLLDHVGGIRTRHQNPIANLTERERALVIQHLEYRELGQAETLPCELRPYALFDRLVQRAMAMTNCSVAARSRSELVSGCWFLGLKDR